jgi:hypothetical protein
MDERKLSTEDVVNMGITNLPAPDTDIPKDRESHRYSLWPDDEVDSVEELIRLVENGTVVDCPEYYGIPVVWKAEKNSYRCILLQYRNVTESCDFYTAKEAVEWFVDTARKVEG